MMSQHLRVSGPSPEMRTRRREMLCPATAHSLRYRWVSSAVRFSFGALPSVSCPSAVATSSWRYSRISAPKYMICTRQSGPLTRSSPTYMDHQNRPPLVDGHAWRARCHAYERLHL